MRVASISRRFTGVIGNKISEIQSFSRNGLSCFAGKDEASELRQCYITRFLAEPRRPRDGIANLSGDKGCRKAARLHRNRQDTLQILPLFTILRPKSISFQQLGFKPSLQAISDGNDI